MGRHAENAALEVAMRVRSLPSTAWQARLPTSILVAVLFVCGCGPSSTPTTSQQELTQIAEPFDVYWPPVDPESTPASARRPLLTGELTIAATPSTGKTAALRASVKLVRPSSEADRAYWNKSLAFADIHWMSEVRVWDVDEQWLWPNLPFMLRLPGEERVERYGGVDPGKHVDNDFAAVLIRSFDAEGVTESVETVDAPLVSAEWHSLEAGRGDVRSIRHAARSDDFVAHFDGPGAPTRGRLKVWLIYADFLGHLPPRTWPSSPEYAGGILAYFEIDWATDDGALRAVVSHKKPNSSTGFNWAAWVRRAPDGTASQAAFRLSNR